MRFSSSVSVCGAELVAAIVRQQLRGVRAHAPVCFSHSHDQCKHYVVVMLQCCRTFALFCHYRLQLQRRRIVHMLCVCVHAEQTLNLGRWTCNSMVAASIPGRRGQNTSVFSPSQQGQLSVVPSTGPEINNTGKVRRCSKALRSFHMWTNVWVKLSSGDNIVEHIQQCIQFVFNGE